MTDSMSGFPTPSLHNGHSVQRYAGHKVFPAFYRDLDPFIQQSKAQLSQILPGITHPIDDTL